MRFDAQNQQTTNSHVFSIFSVQCVTLYGVVGIFVFVVVISIYVGFCQYTLCCLKKFVAVSLLLLYFFIMIVFVIVIVVAVAGFHQQF